jgi:hypothetical protein
MKTEKEKLQAKTVDQLKRYAKKVGAKIVTPEGKAKTKDQLVNSIVMKQRLGGLGERQTGVTNKYVDIKRKAKAPGKRTSASGKKYTERRANRSDKPGQMLGAKTVKAVTPQDYAKRKKAEVQRWYKDCVGDRPIAGLLALTFDKKAGVYGNPEILIVIYRLPKKTAKGSTYSHYVGAIRQSYGNGINDIEKYLTAAQFNKFYENTSRRTLDTATFNEMAKRDNVIYS